MKLQFIIEAVPSAAQIASSGQLGSGREVRDDNDNGKTNIKARQTYVRACVADSCCTRKCQAVELAG